MACAVYQSKNKANIPPKNKTTVMATPRNVGLPLKNRSIFWQLWMYIPSKTTNEVRGTSNASSTNKMSSPINAKNVIIPPKILLFMNCEYSVIYIKLRQIKLKRIYKKLYCHKLRCK